MAFNIGRLSVLITANAKQLKREFAAVDTRMNKLKRSAGIVGGAIAGALSALGVGVIADIRRTNDELLHMSEQLNVSVTDLQELEFVAKNIGVPFKQFATGLQRVTRRAGEAVNGSQAMADNFEMMGINAERFLQVGATDRIVALAEAMNRARVDGRELSQIFKLLDTEGVALNRLARQGGEGVLRLVNVARESGLVSQKLAEDSQESVGFWTELAQRAKGSLFKGFEQIRTGFGLWGETIEKNVVKPMEKVEQATRAAAVSQAVLVDNTEALARSRRKLERGTGTGRAVDLRTTFLGKGARNTPQEIKSKQLQTTNEKLDTLIGLMRNNTTGRTVAFLG